MIESYFKSSNQDFTLLQGNCCKLLRDFDFQFDCIFADPPYFLSNGGISVQSGKVVNVNKGKWDKGKTPQEMTEFNMEWLNLCREKLKDNGLWICGTDIDAKNYYYNQDLKGPLGIVIGNEGQGMSEKVKKNCDFLVKIPMKGKVTSLNASVSTGIVVYEAVKQRM